MDFDSEAVQRLLAVALAEEVGSSDLTASAIGCAGARVQARIIAERNLICAGLPLVQRVFHTLDNQMKMELLASDGVAVGVGQAVLELEGRASGILTGERTALEFLGQLSGIATETRRFVDTVAGTSAKIRCAQLTTPGLRLLERYAMVAGGAFCREGESILLTESHVAVAGGVKAALDQAHSFVSSQMKLQAMTAYEAVGTQPGETEANSLSIQIEVRNEGELREALSAGAESVVLKDMTVADARRCVAVVREARPDCIVDISGGITIQNVRAYAETGADFLSRELLMHCGPCGGFRLLVDSVQ